MAETSTITLRKGSAAEFEPTKMKAGEMAVVLDEEKVMVSYSDGTARQVGGETAVETPYDPSGSRLTATDVQAAIDELDDGISDNSDEIERFYHAETTKLYNSVADSYKSTSPANLLIASKPMGRGYLDHINVYMSAEPTAAIRIYTLSEDIYRHRKTIHFEAVDGWNTVSVGEFFDDDVYIGLYGRIRYENNASGVMLDLFNSTFDFDADLDRNEKTNRIYGYTYVQTVWGAGLTEKLKNIETELESVEAELENVETELDSLELQNVVFYSQTHKQRYLDIPLSVKAGDVIYLRPREWTGGGSPSGFTLFGRNGNSYTELGIVRKINDSGFVVSDGDYASLRMGVGGVAVPETDVTVSADVYVVKNNIYSYSLENIKNLDDIKTGFDGKIYGSAGDAVRGQVADIHALLESVETELDSLELQNVVFYSQTHKQRYLDIPLSVKAGDVIYLRPREWTGEGNPNGFSIFGVNGGSFYQFGTVQEINDPGFITADNDYASLRMGVGGVAVPEADVTVSADVYVLRNNIASYSLAALAASSNSSFVTVSPSGAVKTITEGIAAVSNGGTVYVMPGVYEEQLDIRGKEVHLVGAGKNTCILIDESGDYRTPPVEMSEGSISNMTIIETSSELTAGEEGNPNNATLAYCIHADFDEMENKTIRLTNCIFKGHKRACLGLGSRNGFTLIVENCDFWSGVQEDTSVAPRGAFYAHTKTGIDPTAPAVMILHNNRFACEDSLVFCLEDYGGIGINFEFTNNVLYSRETGVNAEIVRGRNNSTLTAWSDTLKNTSVSYGNNVEILNDIT